MDNYIIGSGLAILIGLIISSKINTEHFMSSPSENSMPLNKTSKSSGFPLFLNFYKTSGADYKLADLIQRLKLNNLSPEWNGVSKNNTSRSLTTVKKLPPIILVPGLGATQIYAKWSKTTSAGVKLVDETGEFEKSDSWSCRQVQDKWTRLWNPDSDGLSSYCWGDNIKVVPTEDGKITNASGVNTTVQEFGSIDFSCMDTLVETLESYGYTQGVNLFGAGYDFRLIGSEDIMDNWCENMTNLIERSCSDQENQAIIISHDLGSVVTNYFLVNSLKEWKDQYIKSFISVSGSFGGSPKALRTLISGMAKMGSVFNKIIKNFSGLLLMLPEPNIYGDNPLIHLNGKTYTSYDIPKLIEEVSKESFLVYNICKKIKAKAMEAPGVPVHTLCGTDLNTESSYNYQSSLLNEPQANFPFYKMNIAASQKFSYPDYFIGDGTVPKFALEYPIFWTKQQAEPVYFQFFRNTEHSKILSSYEPIKYILTVING